MKVGSALTSANHNTAYSYVHTVQYMDAWFVIREKSPSKAWFCDSRTSNWSETDDVWCICADPEGCSTLPPTVANLVLQHDVAGRMKIINYLGMVFKQFRSNPIVNRFTFIIIVLLSLAEHGFILQPWHEICNNEVSSHLPPVVWEFHPNPILHQ